MYAIIKTGGKQYRVQQGESLLVERLTAADGDTVQLRPLLLVDGTEVIDGDGLANVTVEARVVAHERGPKLRIVKFKPKRGYKRRTGHRQELTRIEVTSLGKPASRRRHSSAAKAKAPAPVAAGEAPEAASTAPEAASSASEAASTAPEAASSAPEAASSAPEAASSAPEAASSAPEAASSAPEAASTAPEAGSSAPEAPAKSAAKPAAKRASTSKRQSSKPEGTDGS
jgi:large subunit ribosomal protein L21